MPPWSTRLKPDRRIQHASSHHHRLGAFGETRVGPAGSGCFPRSRRLFSGKLILLAAALAWMRLRKAASRGVTTSLHPAAVFSSWACCRGSHVAAVTREASAALAAAANPVGIGLPGSGMVTAPSGTGVWVQALQETQPRLHQKPARAPRTRLRQAARSGTRIGATPPAPNHSSSR